MVSQCAARLLGAFLGLLLATLSFAPDGQAADAGAEGATPTAAPTLITIGVRAHRGAPQALKQWTPTADYLSQQIPGFQFRMLPYENNSSLNEAVSRGEFHFVLTQPASYVDNETRYGISRLLTLVNKREGAGYSRFGAVIFTRADRSDLNTLEDLVGTRFMAVGELAFGGWTMAWRELHAANIDPYEDFESLMWAGGIQQNVVAAVLRDEADAGTVRTDLLEGMVRAGDLDLDRLKVINAQHTRDFPFMHSTRLYPEWPLAKLAHTSDDLAEKVARALLSLDDRHPAAQAGDYLGWHTPLEYRPVHELLRELKIGPYAIRADIPLENIAAEYGLWILAVMMLIILGFITIARMNVLNRRLSKAETLLTESNYRLRILARQDGLTRLGNRHRLEEFLQQEWGQACRNNRSIAMLILDIDYFKEYNDTYGHLQGDRCLIRVARTAAELFRRAGDLVIRYCGEEFLIVVAEPKEGEALGRAEMLLRKVEALKIEHRGSSVSGYLTISIGISVADCEPECVITPTELIAQADAALYEAKNSGRNRVVFAQQEGAGGKSPL